MTQHSYWRSPLTKFFLLSTHRCLGNVTPVNREPLQITFNPFRENRLSVTVRVTDPSQPPTCRLAFLKEPRKDRVGNVRTICNLSIDLSEEVRQENSYLIDVGRLWEPQKVKYVTKFLASFHDSWTVLFLSQIRLWNHNSPLSHVFCSFLIQNLKKSDAAARLPGELNLWFYSHRNLSFLFTLPEYTLSRKASKWDPQRKNN